MDQLNKTEDADALLFGVTYPDHFNVSDVILHTPNPTVSRSTCSTSFPQSSLPSFISWPAAKSPAPLCILPRSAARPTRRFWTESQKPSCSKRSVRSFRFPPTRTSGYGRTRIGSSVHAFPGRRHWLSQNLLHRRPDPGRPLGSDAITAPCPQAYPSLFPSLLQF